MADDAALPELDGSGDQTPADTVDAAGSRHATPEQARAAADRWAFLAALTGVVILAGFVGWLGFRADEAHNAAARRALYLQVAQQAAVRLTTVDYEHADVDGQRILDLSTGTFHDNFSRRLQSFVDSARQGRQRSVGTVAEAGLESQQANEGRVLVAMTVKFAGPGAAQQEPQHSRMRITVQKIGDTAKVSNVAVVS